MASSSSEWTGTLTVLQAYKAMHTFLEEYYNLTQADEIGALLGGLSLLPDGIPADPGFRQDWLSAVQKVLTVEKN